MFGPTKEQLVDDQLYNLKYMAKTLSKASTGQLRQEKVYYNKAKSALKKGDERIAKAFVKQSKQYSALALRTTELACNLELIGEKINGAIQAGRMNDEILATVSLLTGTLRPDMAVNKIGSMDKMFEDIMVYSNAIDQAVDGVVAPSASATEEEVMTMNDLKEQIAQDASMDFMALPSAGTGIGTDARNGIKSLFY